MKIDLLNGKLNKSYLTLLVSAIGSTLVTTIYSSVDMICVGHFAGPNGAAAVSCMSPMWALIFAFGVLAGVGGGVMMSNRRGAGNDKSANEYYTLSVIISVISSIVLVTVYAIFTEPLLRLFGADGEVLELAIEYTNAVCFSFPTFTVCACLSIFMRNDGEAFIPTIATIIGGVLNIILDIAFVFGLQMGMMGAGLATAIGQVVAFSIILSYFFTKKCNLKFTKVNNIGENLAKITSIGFSAFVIEVASGIVVIVHNVMIMNNLGASHLAVYGAISSAIIMFYCLFNSVGTAMQPLASISFGAGNHERTKGVLKLSVITTLIMAVVFTLLCELFPDAILRIYMDVDDEVMRIGPRIVCIYSLAIPTMGISQTCSSYFQSTLNKTESIIISFMRGLVLPIVFVVTLPLVINYDYIWLGIPIAEAITAATAIIMLSKKLRKPDGTQQAA